MRWVFSFGFALALSLALMAGCGDGNGEVGSGGSGGMAGSGDEGGSGGMAGSGGEGGSGGRAGTGGKGGSGGTGGGGGSGGTAGDAGQGGNICLDDICTGDLERFADEYLGERLQPGGPGMAIAVVGPEGVMFEKSYGMANIAESLPIDADTPFNLASVTKQFTATAAMILYEEGRLRPEDSVVDYFPEAPATWSGMTVQHLFTHQSGIPDFLNDALGGGWTNDEVLTWAVHVPLEFSPGDRYEYSNTGYTLLAILVERISEQSFPSFLEERIFAPLGMVSSSVPEDWPTDIPDEAQSYNQSGMQYEYARRAMGEGTNHSSLRDLERWELSMREPTVVSPETLALMMVPHVSWPFDPNCGYGYGWVICDRAGEPLNVYHDGVSSGYRTLITRAPEEGVTVIMLSNGTFDWAVSFSRSLWRFALGL